MRFLIPALALLVLATGTARAQVETHDVEFSRKQDDETTEAKKLVLKLPVSWKAVERTEEERDEGELAKYTVPGAGDVGEAGFSLYDFGRGGGVKANIDRWVETFKKENRSVSIKRGAIVDAGTRYFVIEVTGTYNEGTGADARAHENYRLMGAILGIQGKGVFFLELVGPDKTVTSETKSLRESFGAEDDEKPVNLDDLK